MTSEADEPLDDTTRNQRERAQEALARATLHGRAALAESARCARALLDAGTLSALGRPAEELQGLAAFARLLDDLAATLSGGVGVDGSDVVRAVLEALDEEIERWEQRSREDGDARAVWRAFVGLREILWEFGMRPRANRPSSASSRASGGRPRVQRVRVSDADPPRDEPHS